ncbi:MAG: hypothetical protein AAF414_15915 [Pseudomonadota bacterium]
MYTKFYKISCDPANTDGLMAHYDAEVADKIRQSPAHVGHQMVETGAGNWLLISNYVSKQAAEDFAPKVKEIVAPMVANFGMEISVLAEGEAVKQVS